MATRHRIFNLTRVTLTIITASLTLLAVQATAGTVYRWTTEDGTIAFTDDEKRIPARYQGTAQVETLESLNGYPRFTAVGDRPETATAAPAPAPRVNRRAPANVALAELPVSVITGSSRYGNGGISLPVGSPVSAESEPILIEQRRVKLSSSMATAHETVVRQGDRIISIQRNESSQRDDTGMVPPLGY
ncbi:MAG: DUF4124 domain-containing protein [Myxococcota bacterium]|nr:DUF4124 domain-containing protein [Myxococcota bacterium]